jgi:hypothetical protein
MHKILQVRNRLAILAASLLVTACASSNSKPPVSPSDVAIAPAQTGRAQPSDSSQAHADPSICSKGFNVAIEADNGTIVRHQVLGYEEGIGRLRFAGKYAYIGNQVYFKFKSTACPNTYWVALLDVFQNGKREMRADSVPEPDIKFRPISPPCRVTLALSVRDGRVAQHDILNAEPGWGPFDFAKFDKPVATFTNWHYPGCKWMGKFPASDGQGRVFLRFQDGSCDRAQLICAGPQ